jgi:hypothetical protein
LFELQHHQRCIHSLTYSLRDWGDGHTNVLSSPIRLNSVTSLRLLEIRSQEMVKEAWEIIRSCQHLNRLVLNGNLHPSYFAHDDKMFLPFWGTLDPPRNVSGNIKVFADAENAPLKLVHLGLERMPLRGIQGSVDLGAITALALDDCDGLINFLSHWRMSKPINLRILRLLLGSHHPISSPGAAFSSFMTSFSGLVEFVLDADYGADTEELLSDGTLEVMLANHFKTLKTVRDLYSLNILALPLTNLPYRSPSPCATA